MKILSWNVNGIRAIMKKGFPEFLKENSPEVLCVQEIKIDKEARAKTDFDFPNYQEFWHSAKRPGYSGTAILVKEGVKAERLPELEWDDEGRILFLDMGDFYLGNIYFPNANHELSRLDFKMDFNDKLSAYFKKLEKDKPVVLCGDFNVAHQEIDLARPKNNVGRPGFHPRERDWMTKLLDKGFVDTWRQLHPEEVKYSWWSYRMKARDRNVGWRIDYFCVSEKFMDKVKSAFIWNDVMGSDHCPVGIEIG